MNASGTTDASGTVQFSDLDSGDYSLNEVVQPGWFATTSLPVEFELDEGESTTIKVGNAQEEEPEPSDVTVIKFHDLNGNSTQERGEPVLEGWDFTLLGRQVETSGTTDASGTSGSHSFPGASTSSTK